MQAFGQTFSFEARSYPWSSALDLNAHCMKSGELSNFLVRCWQVDFSANKLWCVDRCSESLALLSRNNIRRNKSLQYSCISHSAMWAINFVQDIFDCFCLSFLILAVAIQKKIRCMCYFADVFCDSCRDANYNFMQTTCRRVPKDKFILQKKNY